MLLRFDRVVFPFVVPFVSFTTPSDNTKHKTQDSKTQNTKHHKIARRQTTRETHVQTAGTHPVDETRQTNAAAWDKQEEERRKKKKT